MGITIRPAELPIYNGDKTITGSLTIGSSADLTLQRDAADTLAQRRGTNAQAFRIYNTYTDSSNYERLSVGWASNTLRLVTENAGTGSNRDMVLGTGTNGSVYILANNTAQWAVTTSGFVAQANKNLWNGTSALATNATAGFLGVNSCAGAPSGTPASVPTGQIPLVYDSTNHKLYVYEGGAWKTQSAAFA